MSDKPQHYLDGPVVQEAKPRLQKPQLFKVILLNDDYTPMEFVIIILERFFAKSREDATRLMMHVHQKGIGICGIYIREIAETKVRQGLRMPQKPSTRCSAPWNLNKGKIFEREEFC